MKKDAVYFLITNSDGDTYVVQMARDELLEQLSPNKHGDIELVASDALKSVPDMDTNYWGDGFLIIKGEIVTPEAVEVVTRFEI